MLLFYLERARRREWMAEYKWEESHLRSSTWCFRLRSQKTMTALLSRDVRKGKGGRTRHNHNTKTPNCQCNCKRSAMDQRHDSWGAIYFALFNGEKNRPWLPFVSNCFTSCPAHSIRPSSFFCPRNPLSTATGRNSSTASSKSVAHYGITDVQWVSEGKHLINVYLLYRKMSTRSHTRWDPVSVFTDPVVHL